MGCGGEPEGRARVRERFQQRVVGRAGESEERQGRTVKQRWWLAAGAGGWLTLAGSSFDCIGVRVESCQSNAGYAVDWHDSSLTPSVSTYHTNRPPQARSLDYLVCVASEGSSRI